MDSVQIAALRRAADALRLAMQPAPKAGPTFSLARLIGGLAAEDFSGPDFALLRAAAGDDYNPRAPIIPLSVLARDMTAAGVSGSNYLVATDNLAPQTLLRSYSVTAQAGVTVIDGLAGNATLPIVTARPTITWAPDEITQLSNTAATIAQVAVAPKHAAALTVASGQLLRQSPYAESLIREQLLEAAGLALDTAVLNGSGANGQPLGILNTTGIGSQLGTDLANPGVVAMKKLVADSGARDERMVFIGATGVRELLEKRERGSGLGFVWDNQRVASLPAYATTTMPAASLVCGEFSKALAAVWGVQVLADPYSEFRSGKVQFAVRLLVDVAVAQAAAFCKSVSIT